MYLSASGASAASDIIIAVFAALLFVGCIVGLIVLLCRFADDEEKRGSSSGVLCLLIAAGFVLRLVFAMFIRGYRSDYSMFERMIASLRNNGLGGYYAGDGSTVLYPAVYFVYLIFGGLANALGLSEYALGMQFAIKLPLIIAELLTALAAYFAAKRYFNRNIALTLAGFVCVCPMFFIGSSIWCSPIVFTGMFVCFACYFIARKKLAAAIAFAFCAAFSSKEGVYIFPVMAVFSIFHIVRAAGCIKRDGVLGRALLGEDTRAVFTVPLGFVFSLVGSYLIGLFLVGEYDANFFSFIYEFTLAPLAEWTVFTSDGLSVYALFGRNGVAAGPRFPSWLFVCVFAAILLIVVCVVYFTKRNRATMVMLAAFCLFTMQIYFPGSTSQGALTVIPALVVSYALVKDKRILYALFVLGAAYTVNSLALMSGAGQMNNLADYSLDEVKAVSMNGVTVAMSAVALVAHLYYTAVAINIGMTGSKKLLSARRGIGASLKEFFRITKG